MSGAVLLVTGGSGLLGRSVCRLAAADWWVAAPSHDAMDVCDADAVAAAFAAARPAAVVHCAYVRDDAAVIVDGSRVVAEAAARVGARLVHMSTDVVFAGRDAPYTEDDPLDPVHDYGRAKAEAERRVMSACPGAVMVRTSLMYGDADSPPVRMVLDAAAGRSDVAFFADEYRSVVHVDDVAAAVVALAGMDAAGSLHVAGPEPVSRLEFARAVCRAYGLPEDAVRGTTLVAAGLTRPGRLVLDSSRAAGLGVPVPRPLRVEAGAAARRRAESLAAVAEWEEEHGALSADELDAVRRMWRAGNARAGSPGEPT